MKYITYVKKVNNKFVLLLVATTLVLGGFFVELKASAVECPTVTIETSVYHLEPCSITTEMVDGAGDKPFQVAIVQEGTQRLYGYSVYGYGNGFPTYAIIGSSSGGVQGGRWTLNEDFKDNVLNSENGQAKVYSGYLPIWIYHGSWNGVYEELKFNINLTVRPASTPTTTADLIVTDIQPVAVTATGATIQWIANQKSSGKVVYGTGENVATTQQGVTGVLQSSTGEYRYHAVLSGLKPRTTYYYKIVVDDPTASGGTKVFEGDYSYLRRFGTLAEAVDYNPRIQYWYGKVNQHVENGVWKTDPDGVSGANLDKLAYCKKWYPATTRIEDYRYETIFDYKAAGNTGSYVGTHLTTRCIDETPRIAYWYGKVNQHTENGVWKTDPDGVSGADLDKLTYCKKFYPQTTSVAEYMKETIFDWKERGNVNSHVKDTVSYRCVAGSEQGKLIIHSPAVGDTWVVGKIYPIRWRNPDAVVGTTFKTIVDLHSEYGGWLTVFQQENGTCAAVPCTSETQWVVPSDLASGNYEVKITVSDPQRPISGFYYTGSSGQFRIVREEDITITSPAGGEEWRTGTAYVIKWQYPSLFAGKAFSVVGSIQNQNTAKYYRIFQKNDAQCASSGVCADTYSWTIESTTPPGKYRVSITAQLSNVSYTGASNPFSIVSEPVEKIAVYSPAEGDTWHVGKTYSIKWSPPYVVSQGLVKASLTLPKETVTITLAPYYACWDAVLPCAVPMIAPYKITSSAPNTGFYTWKIPSDLPQPYTGTQRITVTLNDTDLRGTSSPFTVVRPPTSTNKPPVISGVSGPTGLRVNEMGKWTVVAYDPDGTYLTYSVDWGDKVLEPLPLGEAVPQKLGQEATFTHSYSQAGRYTIRFTVRDEKGAQVESTLTVEVGGEVSTNGLPQIGPVAIPAEITAGTPITFYFSAQDPDDDYMSWGVSWGDGVGEAGACPASTPGTSYQPSHSWEKPGTYKVEVTVNDCRGGAAHTSFQVIVGVIPVPTPKPLPKPIPVPSEEREGEINALRERIKQLEFKISNLERQVVEAEKRLTKAIDRTLTQRVAGKILLQVEEKGESWYVDPLSEERYYLKDGGTAYSALHAFGLGIKNSALAQIPIGLDDRIKDQDTDGDGLSDKLEEAVGTDPQNADSDADGYTDGKEVKDNYSPLGEGKMGVNQKLCKNLEGRILLQVEDKGQAWYVQNCRRYYMRDGNLAYQIMRFLSLGITNENLRKIAVGEFE